MATMFIRHDVANYAKWRQVFDGFAPTAKTLGVQSAGVYQAADDPNNVTVIHDFASTEAAQAFAQSTELHDAMASAGVASAPTVWFATRA